MAFISFNESKQKIDNLSVEAVGVKRVCLTNAPNRVLAEDIVTKESLLYTLSLQWMDMSLLKRAKI